jgi:hypothetical protein
LATPEEIIMGGGQSSANIQQAGEIVRLKRQLESAETRVAELEKATGALNRTEQLQLQLGLYLVLSGFICSHLQTKADGGKHKHIARTCLQHERQREHVPVWSLLTGTLFLEQP